MYKSFASRLVGSSLSATACSSPRPPLPPTTHPTTPTLIPTRGEELEHLWPSGCLPLLARQHSRHLAHRPSTRHHRRSNGRSKAPLPSKASWHKGTEGRKKTTRWVTLSCFHATHRMIEFVYHILHVPI